ncbi:hypothetical protein ACB092_05G192400 [Castanea dentata]
MGSKCARLTVVLFFVALTLSSEGSARELRDSFIFWPTLSFQEESVSTRKLAETFNPGTPTEIADTYPWELGPNSSMVAGEDNAPPKPS